MLEETACDAYMIARAGTGRPWLYQALLQPGAASPLSWSFSQAIAVFMIHLQGLSLLQNEYRAILQSKTLVRYYFRPWVTREQLLGYYDLDSFSKIEEYLCNFTGLEPHESQAT
jgi:tRNA-dihydrouridine synthase